MAKREGKRVGLGRRVWVQEAGGSLSTLATFLLLSLRSLGQKKQTTASITAFGWCITMVSKGQCPCSALAQRKPEYCTRVTH